MIEKRNFRKISAALEAWFSCYALTRICSLPATSIFPLVFFLLCFPLFLTDKANERGSLSSKDGRRLVFSLSEKKRRAASLFLGLFFSRLFTRKIEELTRNMDRVNHGSREVTVTSDSGDEVGILIRSFRRMMDEINRLIDEVYVNKLSLKEYELKALQAQINPHFLYNTLSAINWMALKGGQKEISRVTLALSAFYRTALSKGEDMVTVENCIRNMEAYLEIQLVMHDNDFTVEWDVDESIKNEKMPKLLLQPVVENALEHGLDEKEEGERKLKLSFLDMDQEMLIMVQDNGPGMDQEKADTLVTYQAQGYGLKNVNDRIRLLYGEDYAVRIFSRPGEGTKVEMRFPKERKKE